MGKHQKFFGYMEQSLGYQDIRFSLGSQENQDLAIIGIWRYFAGWLNYVLISTASPKW
jgi:hypothetical protein